MTTPVMTASDIAHVSCHQLWIAEEIPDPSSEYATRTSLVETVPGAVAVITGIHTGSVSASVDAPRRILIAERLLRNSRCRTTVKPGSSANGRIPRSDPGQLNLLAVGAYRIWAHSAARDIAPDLSLDVSDEQYLIKIWPHRRRRVRPVDVLKQTDHYDATP
jgi:hypothetical protein